MNIRDFLQEDWAKIFLKAGGKGILHLAPRSGKIKTSINILNSLDITEPKVLICYPDKNIQKSWEDDFIKFNYKNPNIEFVTHRSLDKVKGIYDIIVCDEIHLLSDKQKKIFKKLKKQGEYILGLSGTLSKQTVIELKQELKLSIIASYSIDEAVEDGLISDYEINIIKTDLDDSILIPNKIKSKPAKTEKAKYKALSWVIENRGPNLFLNLARMRIIHNSSAKTEKTKRVLSKVKNERVLVFCANNNVAKALGCKVHTSMFNDQKAFDKFINGKGNNHMAVCKIGNTGVSFKDLDHIVINAFDSNSENLTQRICRSLILDTKNKVSKIYIITTTEKAELGWLEKALEFFDENKIKYL